MNSLIAPEENSLDAIWSELETHIRWSERAAALAFFFSDAIAPVQQLRAMAKDALAHHTMALRLLQFDDPNALPGALMHALFSAPDDSVLANGAIQTWPLWIELQTGLGASWDKARHDCLRTLNGTRNQMLDHTSKLIVIVLPLSWHRRVQEIAPDLFSVRSMFVDLPQASESTPEPWQSAWLGNSFPDQNAQDIAPSEEERILRGEYERLKQNAKLPSFQLAQRLGERIMERGDFHAGLVFWSDILERAKTGAGETLFCLALYLAAMCARAIGHTKKTIEYIEQLLSLQRDIASSDHLSANQIIVKLNLLGTLVLASELYQQMGNSARAAILFEELDQLFESLPSDQECIGLSMSLKQEVGRTRVISLLQASSNKTLSNEKRLELLKRATLLARARLVMGN
jgi:hypothetical protein